MRCILCGEPAKEVGKLDLDATVTRCTGDHKVRFNSISADRLAALDDEQRRELARVARRRPDGSFEIDRKSFNSLVAFAP